MTGEQCSPALPVSNGKGITEGSRGLSRLLGLQYGVERSSLERVGRKRGACSLSAPFVAKLA